MPKGKRPPQSRMNKGRDNGTKSAVLSRKAYGLPFSRLKAEAKARALEWGRERVSECFEGEELTRNLEEYVAEKHGLSADKCFWSLGHCQGDGVAFYGAIDLDPLKQAQPEVAAIYARLRLMGISCYLDAHVEGANSHYHHYNSMSARVDVADYEPEHEAQAEQAGEDLQRFLDDFLKDVSRDAERYGYEAVDGETSDEHVQEWIEANEYRFRRDGAQAE